MAMATLLKRSLVSGLSLALATPVLAAEDVCPTVFMITEGIVQVNWDEGDLLMHGLHIPAGPGVTDMVLADRATQAQILTVDATSLFGIAAGEQWQRLLGGELRLEGAISLDTAVGPVHLSGLTLTYNTFGAENPGALVDTISGERIFDVTGLVMNADPATGTVAIVNAYVSLTPEFVVRVGGSPDVSPVVGSLTMKGLLTETEATIGDFVELAPFPIEPPEGFDARGGFPSIGPDVIVGDLPQTFQFGREGAIGSGIIGAAVGTTSCNKGNTNLSWRPMPDVRHPVIAQNLYRRMEVGGVTRFEQIGQSWLKHGFCALQQNLCFSCSPAGGGCPQQLGSGCSDPYDVGLNATQTNLGARSWVNPATGVFTSAANNHGGHSHNGIDHRLQVRDADLAISGALYYVEGQYVAADDSTAGNQWNNVSWRRVNVTGPSGTGVFTFTNNGATVREAIALNNWTTATHATMQPVVGDGLAVLAYEVTDLGGGQWHYEYAIYNMNLNNGYNSFSVPVPSGVTVSDIGFHYPINHGIQVTGAAFDNVDWAVSTSGGAITWSCSNEATNVNANALRWGTLFNFRFVADSGPQTVDATLGLYKSGATHTQETVGPSAVVVPCPADLNGDSVVNLTDLSILLSNFGGSGGPADGDLDGDGQVNLTDLSILLSVFGSGC